MAKKTKPIERRLFELEQLEPMSISAIGFNDLYHIRLTAPNEQTINYYPVSEKWQRMGRWYRGFDELIDYLEVIA